MTEFDIIIGVLFVVTMIGLAYTHKPHKVVVDAGYKMKLLVIFDKDINIPPEKICIHTGHACRFMASPGGNEYLKEWAQNHYKVVLLRGKITDKLVYRIQLEKFYEIRDAGLDGMFEPDTLLGYAVLVEDDCDDFSRIQTLKFKEKE